MAIHAPRHGAVASDATLSLVDAMAQFAFLIHDDLADRATDYGMSMIQTRLLGVLRDRTPSMNELATLLDLDKSSITGLVDRAALRGLVERVPSTSDRRAAIVRLTKDGRSLVSKVAASFEKDVATILDSLSEVERDMLKTLATRVLIANPAIQREIH
jgi:DNA-binding MarR family transcriptional regulator